MAEETPEEKIARYEFVLDAYVRELTTLREENERLKASASAHQTLASIYSDPDQPTGHRIKAAGLALGVETPRLESVPPPLNLVAEEYEPLAVVVERQRARARMLQSLPMEQRELLARGVQRDGNGNGSNDSSD
jgi:hypothetical protein